MRKIVQSALSIAAREVGVQESPRGSNWGAVKTTRSVGYVADYIRTTGYDSPVFWCMCFVYWVLRQTLGSLIAGAMPRSGSCDDWLHWARRNKILHTTPQAGDVFLVMASADDAIHTGFVVEVLPSGRLRTIEGNSNNDGSNNGYAVVQRERANRSLLFVRWPDVIPETEGAAAPVWKVLLQVPGKNAPETLGNADVDGAGTALFPVRSLLARLLGSGETATKLAWDNDLQGLTWEGKLLPLQAVRRGEGTVWAPLRTLGEWTGAVVEADAGSRTITIFPPSII